MLLIEAWNQCIAALETVWVHLNDINNANKYRSDTYIERIQFVVINQFKSSTNY